MISPARHHPFMTGKGESDVGSAEIHADGLIEEGHDVRSRVSGLSAGLCSLDEPGTIDDAWKKRS